MELVTGWPRIVFARTTYELEKQDCAYLLHLRSWNIVLQGLDPSGPGSSTFAVIGGTGAFRDASGDALFTDTERKTDMRISLTG